MFFVLIVIASSINQSYSQSIFQKNYSSFFEYNNGGRWGANVLQTADSGFVLTGLNYDTLNTGADDIYFIKTNQWGDTLWTKIYGTSSDDLSYRSILTSDGGYAFCGQSNQRAILVKTNSVGDTLWTKQYNTNSYSMANSLRQTIDGGFVLAGFYGLGTFNSAIFLLKTDSGGIIEWSKVFDGGPDLDEANSIFEIPNSGYILSGFTQKSYQDDIVVVKTDLGGNLVWSKTYGGTGNDIPFCMENTSDGGFVIAGCTSSFNLNNQDIYISKIDSLGNLIWSKDYNKGGLDETYCIARTKNSGFIVSAGVNTAGKKESLLLKLNVNGDTLWTRVFDTLGIVPYSVSETYDGGYAVLLTRLNALGTLSLIKTDSTGNSCSHRNSTIIKINNNTIIDSVTLAISTPLIVTTSWRPTINSRGNTFSICSPLAIHESTQNNLIIHVNPNPFETQITFTMNSPIQNATFQLFSVIGKEERNISFSGGQLIVDRGVLSEGIYFYKIISQDKAVASGKIIVQ